MLRITNVIILLTVSTFGTLFGPPVHAQCVTLAPSVGSSLDRFGFAIDLNGDLAIVGVPEDDTAGSNKGAVVIFRLNPGTGLWEEEARIVAPAGTTSGGFGSVVAIDTNVALIGLPFEAGDGLVYTYVWDGVNWLEGAQITSPSDLAQRFGDALSYRDGLAVVGDPWANNTSGDAYVFDIDPVSGAVGARHWLFRDLPIGDEYGTSVAVDNPIVVVGEPEHDGGGTDAGAVHVFRMLGGNAHPQEQMLTASDAEAGDRFGIAVAVHGTTIAVGASLEDEAGSSAGAVYTFEFDAMTSTWAETGKLLGCGGSSSRQLGRSVALFGDRLIAGGRKHAYLFERSAGAWSFIDRISPASSSFNFANSVALNDAIGMVGAPGTASVGRVEVFGDLADPSCAPFLDCNLNGIPDGCDLDSLSSFDCNSNFIPDECDITAGLEEDCDDNLIPDACEITDYQFDSGAGISLGFSDGVAVDWIWMNQFNVVENGGTLTSISVAWPPAVAAASATLLVYSDPDQDLDPTDGVLLRAVEVFTSPGDGESFTQYSIPDTTVGDTGDSFFVGVFIALPDGGAGALISGLLGRDRSWMASSVLGAGDIMTLANNSTPPGLIEDICCPGDWLLRADAQHASGLPVACAAAGDANNDGVVGIVDFLTVLAQWGACVDCPADFDGDDIVGINDFLIVLANWS